MQVISGKSGRFTDGSSSRRVGARMPFVCAATIALLVATACSSSSSGAGAGPKPGPNVITADEVPGRRFGAAANPVLRLAKPKT